MTTKTMVELIEILTRNLAISLELSYEPHEFLLLWPEAVDGIARARVVLADNDVPFPGAAENILNATRSRSN